MFFHAVRILLCRPFIGTVQTHRSIDTIRRICKGSAWEIVRIVSWFSAILALIFFRTRR